MWNLLTDTGLFVMNRKAVATFSTKAKQKDINLNRCQYRTHGRVKHDHTQNRGISRDVIGQTMNQSYW